jgi:hypothetical protein
MNSITGNQSAAKAQETQPDYFAQHQARFNAYVAKQPGIVRVLHGVLLIMSVLCMVLAVIMFFVAIYDTIVWVTTGDLTNLDVSWVNFGLSMSFLVFPWGLDAMLLRAFPTLPMVRGWFRPKKPVNFITGFGAFWAGFGIMCAGAPGAVYMYGLASQAIQNL